MEELMGAVLSVACSYVPGWSGNPPGDVMRLEEREDNAVRVHRMGEDEDELRSDEEGGQLMRSEEEEEEKGEEEEEKVPWKSLEGDDVMSRLFDWDFDQLLRQVSLSKKFFLEQSTILICSSSNFMNVKKIWTNIF